MHRRQISGCLQRGGCGRTSQISSALILPTTNVFTADKTNRTIKRRGGAAGGWRVPGSDGDKCHTLNHMFLLKLSDRAKGRFMSLWNVCVSLSGVAMDVPWHSQHQFKHSWPAWGDSSSFIRNAKVTLKMQFINPRRWTLFFILLWKINVIELEGCQCWLLPLSLSISGGGGGEGAVVVHGFDLYKQQCHIKEKKKKSPGCYSHFITWSGTLDRHCALAVQARLW